MATKLKLNGLANDTLKGVIPFLSTDETKFILTNVYSTGKELHATDGHKAITVPCKLVGDVPKGLYEIAKGRKGYVLAPSSDDGQYPDVVKALPKKNTSLCSFAGGTNIRKEGHIGALAFKLARHGKGVRVNLSYIEAVPAGDWDVKVGGSFTPVEFVEKNGTHVVIMPMRA